MEAFPEVTNNVPLNNKMDIQNGYNLYTKEVPFFSQSQRQGSLPYTEPEDNNYNIAIRFPFVTDRRPFHSIGDHDNVTTDPVMTPNLMLNNQFNHLIKAYFPENGFKQPSKSWSSSWETSLAKHHGLYNNQQNDVTTPLTSDDILIKTNKFSQLLEIDNPQDPCRALSVQEFQCLHAMQSHIDPQGASKRCVKWFNEWQQCKWDNEKYIKGYNYLEMPAEDKHKPYIAAPDPQYS